MLAYWMRYCGGKMARIVKTHIFEGPTEEAVIKALGLHGRNFKFNLNQNFIKTKVSTLSSGELYLFLDMDEISQLKAKNKGKIAPCLEMLEKNVSFLAKSRSYKKIYIVLQYYNLEDEIAYASGKTKAQLLKSLSVSSEGELKTKINKSQNLLKMLEDVGFDSSKFWHRNVCEEHRAMVKRFLSSPKVKLVTLSDIIV